MALNGISWIECFLFVNTFLTCFLSMKVLTNFALNRSILLDDPKEQRKIHPSPIPLIGGLALGVSILANLCVFQFFIHTMNHYFTGIFLASLVSITAGVLDDQFGLRPITKIFFQLCTAVILVWSIGTINKVTFPTGTEYVLHSYQSLFITIFIILGAVNATNLVDGMDGLAGGSILLTNLSIAFLANKWGEDWVFGVSIIVVGGIIAFLIKNWSPAVVFMGDSGSLLLGTITIALLLILVENQQNQISIWLIIPLMFHPFLDASYTIIRRVWTQKSIFAADSSHIHHSLLRGLSSQKLTVGIIHFLSLLIIVITIFLLQRIKYTLLISTIIGTSILSLVGLSIFYGTTHSGRN